MTNVSPSFQDNFLTRLCVQKIPTTVFLLNGIKLQGLVTGFDAQSLLLRRESHSQLVYNHAIATIMPQTPMTSEDAV